MIEEIMFLHIDFIKINLPSKVYISFHSKKKVYISLQHATKLIINFLHIDITKNNIRQNK